MLSSIMNLDSLNIISGKVLSSSIAVHKELGPGLLESVYESCLVYELRSRNLLVDQQVVLPIYYKNSQMKKEFRIDLLVENEIIVEVKSMDGILPIHEAQLLTYLKLAKKRIGLLVNFNVLYLKQGFKRMIFGY